jgi:putative FmdB family regulatory protein
MPLYEYECQACGQHFDVRHSANETPDVRCEACQGATKKVFCPAAIIFKGSGWYITDSAPKAKPSDEAPVPAPPAAPAVPAPTPAAAAAE